MHISTGGVITGDCDFLLYDYHFSFGDIFRDVQVSCNQRAKPIPPTTGVHRSMIPLQHETLSGFFITLPFQRFCNLVLTEIN